MLDLTTTLDRMTTATTLEDVWHTHSEAMALFGFDRLLYALTVTHSTDAVSPVSDVLILSNHDAAYTEKFIHGGMHRDAPMLNWALHNYGACSWSWLAEQAATGELSPSARRVLTFNQQHGVTAGYTISFASGVARRRSAIALTAKRGINQSRVDELWHDHGRDIIVLNHVMNLCAITLPAEKMLDRLTLRQREVLERVADGMSVAEVAEHLNRSVATVEKHLRLARSALGCETTAQAVTKAAMQQQLYLAPNRQKRSM